MGVDLIFKQALVTSPRRRREWGEETFAAEVIIYFDGSSGCVAKIFNLETVVFERDSASVYHLDNAGKQSLWDKVVGLWVGEQDLLKKFSDLVAKVDISANEAATALPELVTANA